MAYTHSPKIVTNGLTLTLDAGNTKSYPGSGTAWRDLTINRITGTLTNGPTFNSANGGSIAFDGTNDYIDGLGAAITSTTQVSVCIWNNGEVAKNSVAFWFNDAANGYDRICQAHLPWSDSTVYFDCGASSTTTYDRINKLATSAEYQGWHYWVFTKNTTTGNMFIYLDGRLWHSGTSKTAPLRTCNIGYIGNGGAGSYHQGKVSLFSVYSRELSVDEIQQNFNANRKRFGL